MVIEDPEADLDFSRVVHGDQGFSYKRQIIAGDELTSQLSVESVKELAGNQMIAFLTRIFDSGWRRDCLRNLNSCCEGKLMELGEIVFEKKLQLTRDSLVRYAGASGDFNPIHYRDDIATQVGLPGVLAHGMLTMGAAISPLFDKQGLTVVDYSVRFSKPVVVDAEVGAELNVSAEVVELDGDRAKLAVKAVFSDQTVMAKSFAWVENAKT